MISFIHLTSANPLELTARQPLVLVRACKGMLKAECEHADPTVWSEMKPPGNMDVGRRLSSWMCRAAHPVPLEKDVGSSPLSSTNLRDQ